MSIKQTFAGVTTLLLTLAVGCASPWDQQKLELSPDDPRFVSENPSATEMIALFEESSQVAIDFWTAPYIVDHRFGGYSIWFDENGQQIEITDEMLEPYLMPKLLDTFDEAIKATKLEDADERIIKVAMYQQMFEQTTKFLIPHLRVMYMHAVALSQCTDEAERARLQQQYDQGVEYIEKFRSGDRFYNLLNFRGEVIAQNSLPPTLDYRWYSEYQTIAVVYLLYVGAEIGEIIGDQRMIDYALEAYDSLNKYAYDAEYSGYYNYMVPAGEERVDTDKNIGLNMHLALGLAKLAKLYPERQDLQDRLAEITARLEHNSLTPDGLAYDYVARDWTEGDYSAIPDDQRVLVGHNAELVWYLEEAAGDSVPLEWYQALAEQVCQRVRPDGAVYIWTALDGTPTPIFESRWWCQLEVMIMLSKLYELTGDEAYFKQLQTVVKYTYNYMVDPSSGFWYSGYETQTGKKLYQGGMHWKSGLHLQRAMTKCIESLK